MINEHTRAEMCKYLSAINNYFNANGLVSFGAPPAGMNFVNNFIMAAGQICGDDYIRSELDPSIQINSPAELEEMMWRVVNIIPDGTDEKETLKNLCDRFHEAIIASHPNAESTEVKVTITPKLEEDKKSPLNNTPTSNNSIFNAADFGGTSGSLFAASDLQQEQNMTVPLNKEEEEDDNFLDLSSNSSTLNNSNVSNSFSASNNINNFSSPISSNNIPSSSNASQPNPNNAKNNNGVTIHIGNSSSKKNNTLQSNAQILASTSSIIQPVPNKTTWQTAREACETFAKSKNLIVTNSIQKEFTITHPNNQIHPITVQQNGDENSPVSISTADATVGSTKAMLVELAKSIAAEYAKTGEAEIEIEAKDSLAQELKTLLKTALGENAKVTVTIKRPQEAPKFNPQNN